MGQDLTVSEIMKNVYQLPKPNTSIMEIKLEITRIKRKKEKVKVREFTRFEKFYDSGKYSSKSLARFQKPKIVKGTGLLSPDLRGHSPVARTWRWKAANDPSLDSLNTLDDIEARELRNDYSAASVMDYVDLKADEADEAEPL